MIQERIVALLESFDKVNDAKNITATANLTSDLGLDSLDVVEVVMAIEEVSMVVTGRRSGTDPMI